MSVSECVTVCDSCIMLCWMSSNGIIEIHIKYSYLSVFHVVGVRWKPAFALLCSAQNIFLLECLQFWFSFCKQYTLIKACHLRSDEYIYCNVSIFRRWIWLRNSLCSRGADNVSWKLVGFFFLGKGLFSGLCCSIWGSRVHLKDHTMLLCATCRQKQQIQKSLKVCLYV